jgi:membrane-associated protease RseP (regulator of RpoE activity)
MLTSPEASCHPGPATAEEPFMRPSATLLSLLIAVSGSAGAATAPSYPPPTGADQNRPMLGVQMTPVPLSVQETEGLTPTQGVYVQSIFTGTAAQNMGLQTGDVVLTVNGAQISSMTDLRNEVALNQVGDPVEVTVQRQGQQVTSTGQFQPWPSNIPYEPIDPGMEQNFRDWQERRLDQARQDLDDLRNQVDGLKKQLGQEGADGSLAAADAAGGDGAAQGPAWRFRYQIASRSPAGAATPGTPTAGPAAVELGISVPIDWRFKWQVASAPAANRGTP